MQPQPIKRKITMGAGPLLTADVVGLTKVAPLSRRGFMTASAAVTAGYTLAAGPVRADVIKTDTTGLTAGEAKIKVADGEMPGYFAVPTGSTTRRWCWSRWRSLGSTNISRT